VPRENVVIATSRQRGDLLSEIPAAAAAPSAAVIPDNFKIQSGAAQRLDFFSGAAEDSGSPPFSRMTKSKAAYASEIQFIDGSRCAKS